jgi:hypothetical protein
MNKYSPHKVIVKNKTPFIQHDELNKFIIYNSNELKNYVPVIEGRLLFFGCQTVPAFIDGTYVVKNFNYYFGGGGYHTVAILEKLS